MADIEYHWSEYIKAGSEALVLLRTLYPLLPTQSRDEVEAKIEAAQQALEIANAKIAQEIGISYSRLRVSTGSNALQQGRERTSLFEVRIYRKLQSRPSACPRGECCLSVSIAVTGALDRVAQIAERKYCRAQARPFRLGFLRKVPVLPICPPAAL
jgi:hypothetical protein